MVGILAHRRILIASNSFKMPPITPLIKAILREAPASPFPHLLYETTLIVNKLVKRS